MNVRFHVEPDIKRGLVIDFAKFVCVTNSWLHDSENPREVWALSESHAKLAYADCMGIKVTQVEVISHA